MSTEKIGVFGGTFHPVHNGHLMLAKHAAEALGIDRVLFVIDRIPPHKTLAEGADDSERLEILRPCRKTRGFRSKRWNSNGKEKATASIRCAS